MGRRGIFMTQFGVSGGSVMFSLGQWKGEWGSVGVVGAQWG